MNSTITTPFIGILLSNLLAQVPILLLFGIGLVIAISRWRKHPKVSLFVIAGCALEIAIICSFAAVYGYLALSGARSSSPSQLGYVYQIAGFLRGVLSAIALGLIIAAAFINRSSAESSENPPFND